MVLDILAAIGLKEAGSYVAKDVLLPLLQGSLEDYAKDFFKSCITDAAGLAHQEPVQKALGKALKAFVELVEAELEFQGCTGAEIRDLYELPLRKFMQDAEVKATLGRAFEPDCRSIDAEVLALRWTDLELHPLPEEFDWPQIGKQYVRSVKGILRSDDALRDLLKLHNQEAMRRGIDALVGIPPDFDLRKYQETLREQYGNLKLESLDTTGYAYNDLKLWRMFIPQDVRTCQEFNPKVYEIPKEKLQELQQRGELDAEALEAAQIEAYRRTYVEQPIQNVLEVVGRTEGVGQRNRPVADYAVVLGDPGSGKSTLLQYVALQWAEQPIQDLKELAQRPLPLLIELRKYARDRNDKKCSSIVEYQHQGDIACRLNQQRLHEVLTAGDAVALFDGIDEVFDPNLRDMVVIDIHRFTNNYPQVQVVVTSRWLGYKAQSLRDAGFQHYMLQDLTDEQIAEFIQRWHDQTFPEGADKVRKRERLHKAIRESKAIRELAGNPLLLTMMAILNRHQELPRDRPELYNQASRVLLHKWDAERYLADHQLDGLAIEHREKQAVLRQVAHHMQSNEAGLAGNIISENDLEAILISYLKSIDIDKPRTVARCLIQQLRGRNFILCYLGAENYAFVHRTFLEFFAAWAFVWEFKETHTLTFEELRDQTFRAHWQEESWQEVLRLIAGMIETKFVGQTIEFLMAQNGGEYKYANLFLAAESLAEVRQRIEIRSVAKTLLEKIKALTQFDLHYYYGGYFDDKEIKLVQYVRTKAVLTVSTSWAESHETLLWLKTRAQQDEDSNVRQAAIQEVARGFKDVPDILLWLKIRAQQDENEWVRRTAVEVLARYFRDVPDTLLWLKARAQQEKDTSIRETAVKALARYFKDDRDTLPILKTRAQQDEDEWVREAALEALAQNFEGERDTLSWLKTWAQTDKSNLVRWSAVQKLAQGFEDDKDVLPILKTRAQQDEDWEVRRAALESLAQYFKDDKDTLPIIKILIQQDEEPKVRETAIEALVRHFKDDKDTLPILKTLIQQDKERWVRETAIEALVRHFKDDKDTLPFLGVQAQENENWDVRQTAVETLAQSFKNEPTISLLLKRLTQTDNDNYLRWVAVRSLAEGFKSDSDILCWLKTWAQKDESSDVRQAAVQALARDFKDDKDTLPILKARAQHDEDRDVRKEAVQALARYFRSDKDTLLILETRVQEDEDWVVRQAAVQALSRSFKDALDTLSVLKTRAQADEDVRVRRTAVRELARCFKDDLNLFEIWCDCVLHDPFEARFPGQSSTRQIAFNVLVKQYPDHPKTRELLQDRAQNDNDEQLRKWATEQLAKLQGEA